MYYWLVCADGSWRGSFSTYSAADNSRESMHDDIFESDYRDLSKAKQAYREQHPEFRHKNFKAGVR